MNMEKQELSLYYLELYYITYFPLQILTIIILAINFVSYWYFIHKITQKIGKIMKIKVNSSFSYVSIEILKVLNLQEVMLVGYTTFLYVMIIYTQSSFDSLA